MAVGTAATGGLPQMNSVAARGLRGRPSIRASTLVVPAGMIPRAVPVPARPLAMWWTTPSPPIATTTSNRSAAAAALIDRASAVVPGHSVSTS